VICEEITLNIWCILPDFTCHVPKARRRFLPSIKHPVDWSACGRKEGKLTTFPSPLCDRDASNGTLRRLP
jgi:hypothetical protein